MPHRYGRQTLQDDRLSGRHGRPGRIADVALVEGAYFDGRPQGGMEPERYGQPAVTFRIDTAEREIYDVNLEDYH